MRRIDDEKNNYYLHYCGNACTDDTENNGIGKHCHDVIME